eukprot:GDKJ01002387.1.p1 GENE.GDKJ01002387.1~~GDKJ01002387.1.p1  ORF type:complete len:882 (-),score=198.60 GDKJ01002387.1:186-2831(-)
MSVQPSQLRSGTPVPPNHQRQVMKPPVHDREKVLQFLRSSGHYRAHASMLIDMAETEGFDGKKFRDEPLSKIRDAISSAFTTLTLPSITNYENMYKEFREWSKNSLIEFQLPYLLVAYPIMLHIYLMQIFETDEPRDALEFLRRNAWEHIPVRGEEIVQLLSTRPDRAGVSLHPTLHSFIQQDPPLKMTISIPRLAHQLIMTHLVATKNTLLLEIIGRRIKFNILEDSSALPQNSFASSSNAGFSATSTTLSGNLDPSVLATEISLPNHTLLDEFATLQSYQIRWGLPKEPWEQDAMSSFDKRRKQNQQHQPNQQNIMRGYGFQSGVPRYDGEPADSISLMALGVPFLDKSTPAYSRLYHQNFASLMKRAEVSSQKHPRTLHFSIANSQDCISMDMTSQGGHFVAVGSALGPIRITCLHSAVQALRKQQTGVNVRPSTVSPFEGGQHATSNDPSANVRRDAIALHHAINPDGSACFDLVEDDTVEPFKTVATATRAEQWLEPVDLIGHDGAVYDVKFSPDERLLLSGGADGSVRLWSIPTKSCLVVTNEAHRISTNCVEWFHHGGYFLSGGGDGVARLFAVDRASDGPIREFSVRSGVETGAVRSMAVHPNSTMVVTSTADRIVRVWDVRAARCCRIFCGLTSSTYSTAVSHSGRLVAAGSSDGSLSLWDLPTGRLIGATQAHRGLVTALDFSRGSNVLVSGGVEGVVRMWDVQDASYGRLPSQQVSSMQHMQQQQQGPNSNGGMSGGVAGMNMPMMASSIASRPIMIRKDQNQFTTTTGASGMGGVFSASGANPYANAAGGGSHHPSVHSANMMMGGGASNLTSTNPYNPHAHQLLREDRSTMLPLNVGGKGLVAPGAKIARVRFTGANLLMVGSLTEAV